MGARAPRLLAAALGALVLAPAAGAETPDPGKRGPYPTAAFEFALPAGEVGEGAERHSVAPVGVVHHPAAAVGRFPAIVALHGTHSTCTSALDVAFTGPGDLARPEDGRCSLGVSPPLDSALAMDVTRSYRGYDYLAELLASHGYVVASIDATGLDAWGDQLTRAAYVARAQMIARTFDRLAGWDAGGGPVGPGVALAERIDMGRLGVLGHSRGGQGVSAFAEYNATRPTTSTEAAARGLPDHGPRRALRAVFSIAPVDGQGGVAPVHPDVAYATLLPYCDGDVFPLSGAAAFERNHGSASAAGNASAQYLVDGANHNWFNSRWRNDETGLFGFGDPNCTASPGPTRLSAEEQRRVAVALVGAFLRRHVGGEEAFDPIVRGEALPATACPDAPAVVVTCANVVRTSYVAPALRRRVLLAADRVGPLPALGPAGDAVRMTGFATASSCEPAPSADGVLATTGCGSSPNRSTTPQLTLEWAGPARIVVDLREGDLSRFRTLTFRGFLNTASPLNPPGTEPRVAITLADAAGRSDTVSSDLWSAALEPPQGTTARKHVLSDVRVPLTSFGGVDLHRAEQIVLEFGAPGAAGSVQFDDLALQD